MIEHPEPAHEMGGYELSTLRSDKNLAEKILPPEQLSG